MLTWNVLCITSRLQNNLCSQNVISNDDKVIYQRLNQALVELVNYSKYASTSPSWLLATLEQHSFSVNMPFMGYYQDTDFEVLRQNTERTLQELYLLTRCVYGGHLCGGQQVRDCCFFRRLALAPLHNQAEIETFRRDCIEFGERFLGPSIEHLKVRRYR